MADSIATRFERVRDRMVAAAERSGRDPERITLILVTKGVTNDRIREAVAAGATVLGENRVQEALKKIKSIEGGMRWHLIGHLQRNKVKLAIRQAEGSQQALPGAAAGSGGIGGATAPHGPPDKTGPFEMIHSVDSLELAGELDRQAGRAGIRQRVLIQVNTSRESRKHGVLPEGAEALVRETAALPHLLLEGMMTIPPQSNDPEESRTFFRSLRERADALRGTGLPVRELSMGMSNDYEVAIEEGATLIRVGTAIFGSARAERG
jgi:PLP dependent protein